MKSVTLSVSLTGEEIKKAAARYHFDPKEQSRIKTLYEAVFPLIRVQAFFSMSASGQVKETGQTSVLCAVTLGEKIDMFQELYSSVQAVSDAYILECIGNTILEKAYGMLGSLIYHETGLFLNTYAFPGSHMPLERTGNILKELAADREAFPIRCNSSYSLQPKKSVVFVGGLEQRKRDCGICGNCEKKDCEYRQANDPGEEKNRGENYNYGYQRIFGNREKGEIK